MNAGLSQLENVAGTSGTEVRKSGRSVKMTEKAANSTVSGGKKRKNDRADEVCKGEKTAKAVAMANVRAATGKGKQTQIFVQQNPERHKAMKLNAAAVAKFVDEDTEFTIEVDGQASEFLSEPENESDGTASKD